jgi:hypothetical protein
MTRIELAVVITVIVLLLGLVPSCIHNTREPANRAKCQNNIKQLGLAVHHYASTFEDELPPAYARKRMGDTEVGGSILFWLLAYLEQDALYRYAYPNGGGNWAGANGPQLVGMRMLMCPADVTNAAGGMAGPHGPAVTSYAANYLLFGYGSPDEQYDESHTQMSRYTIADIPDGTSNTVMWSEHSAVSVNGGIRLAMMYGPDNGGLPPNCVLPLFNYPGQASAEPKWDGNSDPPNLGTQFWMPQFNPTGATGSTPAIYNMVQGYHTAILLVGIADGSVRSINASVSTSQAPWTWARAIDPQDGKTLGSDW